MHRFASCEQKEIEMFGCENNVRPISCLEILLFGEMVANSVRFLIIVKEEATIEKLSGCFL